MFYDLIRPLIFQLDAETAHGLAIQSLLWRFAGPAKAGDPILKTNVAGLDFPNPVGMAAGFDKDGQVPAVLTGLGFGFAEVGTLTPKPQAGNPKPRIFRLAEDRAVINRLGFNNGGQEAALPRLKKARERMGVGLLGINIGANKDSDNRIADYAMGVRKMAALADYLTVNISSPNTPGLRALQDKGALDALLAAVIEARGDESPPVFLKVAPDLTAEDIADIVAVAIGRKIDALIISNTTISRPPLKSNKAGETGGLSGAPLKDLAQQMLINFRKESGGAIPLIGVGGIATAEDAYARIRAGASLVQLYSAMVYRGPSIARDINTGLAELLRKDGFANVTDAVGVDHV